MRSPPGVTPAVLAGMCLLSACVRQDASDRGTTSAALLQAARPQPLVAREAVAREGHHVLLTLQLEGSTLKTLDAREVAEALPQDRVPADEPWRVLVEDAQGQTLFLAQLGAPRGLRAEVARPDGTLEPVAVEQPAPVVVVRTPVLKGAARLRLYARARTLPERDARAASAEPEGMVEVAQAAYPAVAQ